MTIATHKHINIFLKSNIEWNKQVTEDYSMNKYYNAQTQAKPSSILLGKHIMKN